ncbi:MAG: hypothetical protein WBO55_01795 [Rhizobiaceae bacterium]
MAMKLRLLAFAVASGKLAYVFLIGDELMEWRVSDLPKRSPAKAIAWAKRNITALVPDVIVTEDTRYAAKKGAPAKAMIEAIAALAEAGERLNPRIRRQHRYANKYEEAEAIAERYPELRPWLPGRWRRFFDNEPRNTVLFEAMANALCILADPAPSLARALG